jgi:hypothetical protein
VAREMKAAWGSVSLVCEPKEEWDGSAVAFKGRDDVEDA